MRIQRSFAFRYEGLSQQDKFLRVSGEKVSADTVVERVKKVERDALALGYPTIHNKKGKCIGIGMAMPTVTEIVRETLNKEETYRLFSAVAHAHFWALNNLSLQRAIAAMPPKSNSAELHSKGAYLEKALKPVRVAYLVSEIMDSFARLVLCKFEFFGWPINELRGVLEKSYDKMHLKSSVRFWRKEAT